MDLGLGGRKALVTAASKGLGRACAEALVQESADVFISSRDEVAIAKTAAEIKAAGWFAADLSKPNDPEALVKKALTQLGELDVLVVNAGGPPPGTFQTTPIEMWEVAFNLTLMSAVRLIQTALPHLKRSGQGRIVIITSISVRQPIGTLVLSNSLRGGVTGLAKTLSREVAPDGITVNCLAPDTILTDRTRQLAAAAGGDLQEELARRAAATPMGRFGDPSEFGAACAFLCSKQAGYITGQTIGIDGGALAGVH
jgi:3-oxoacyl-[acyl-carrier protein] reductase